MRSSISSKHRTLFLDTETLYTKAMQTIAGRYGKQFTWDIKVHQMGKTRNESAHFFIGKSCFIYKSTIKIV